MSSLLEGFHIPLSVQARHEVWDLHAITAKIVILTEGKDRKICVWGNSFSSSKLYNFFCKDVHVDISFGWIWKSKCTMKLEVFAWLLLSDWLNTRNMLRRRNFTLNSDFNCLLCAQYNEETVEHLFFIALLVTAVGLSLTYTELPSEIEFTLLIREEQDGRGLFS